MSRRSLSYSREPRSPSWNEQNFNSSGVTSPSKTKSDADLSENEEMNQLNLQNLRPSDVSDKLIHGPSE